jgi:hypothetical protein
MGAIDASPVQEINLQACLQPTAPDFVKEKEEK